MRNEIRAALDAIANSWIPKTALAAFATCLTATAVLAIIQNTYAWLGISPPTGITSIDVGRLGVVVGTAGTASAFLATLFVTERNYRKARLYIPHLTMQLHIDRAAVSSQYDAIFVILEAKNTGSGLCNVNEIQWALQALSPYDDATTELMDTEFKERGDSDQETEFPWHQLAADATTHIIAIEPGETEQMTHDFIIPHQTTAVVASAWVSNASQNKTTDGWYRRTPHIL